MSHSADVRALRRILQGLEGKVKEAADKAASIALQHEFQVQEVHRLRRQAKSVQDSINTLGGDSSDIQGEREVSTSLLAKLRDFLADGSKTMRELEILAEASGFSRHQVRGALQRNEFTKQGKYKGARYLLRESLWTSPDKLFRKDGSAE